MLNYFFTDGYREDDIAYDWDKENPVQVYAASTEFLNEGIELESHSTERCDVETRTGKYSCIRLNFVFKGSI